MAKYHFFILGLICFLGPWPSQAGVQRHSLHAPGPYFWHNDQRSWRAGSKCDTVVCNLWISKYVGLPDKLAENVAIRCNKIIIYNIIIIIYLDLPNPGNFQGLTRNPGSWTSSHANPGFASETPGLAWFGPFHIFLRNKLSVDRP